MALKVLADGKTKLTVLTTRPALWGTTGVATITELNAGIDASCLVLSDGFTFGPADSDKVSEPALCTKSNANSVGRTNGEAGFTYWRWFDEEGGFDAAADELHDAVKTPGTPLWIYGRRMDKDATSAWAATDEIYYAAEVITDRVKPPSDSSGFIKYILPLEVQSDFQWLAAAAGA